MRRATLASPPVFHFESQSGCRISLASDTGARAEIFVLEPDLIRLMVLPKGQMNHPRTWTIAPGEALWYRSISLSLSARMVSWS